MDEMKEGWNYGDEERGGNDVYEEEVEVDKRMGEGMVNKRRGGRCGAR